MDRGSENVSEFANALFQRHRLVPRFIAERTSQSNGGVERFMNVINLHLSKAMSDGVMDPKTWSVWMSTLAEVINGTYDEKLGNTPFYLQWATNPSLKVNSEPITGLSRKTGPGREVSTAELMAKRVEQYDHCVKLVRERLV